jgi:hypothetical protein
MELTFVTGHIITMVIGCLVLGSHESMTSGSDDTGRFIVAGDVSAFATANYLPVTGQIRKCDE